MSDNDNSGSVLAAFLAGGAIGAAVGLLFAPKSGDETRRDITGKAEKLLAQAEEAADKAKAAADEVIQSGKKIATKEKKAVESAVKAGKKAWEKGRG